MQNWTEDRSSVKKQGIKTKNGKNGPKSGTMIKKSPYLFFLYFGSMYHKYLPCQILSHDFDEKSDFFNYEFSIKMSWLDDVTSRLLFDNGTTFRIFCRLSLQLEIASWVAKSTFPFWLFLVPYSGCSDFSFCSKCCKHHFYSFDEVPAYITVTHHTIYLNGLCPIKC